MITQVSFDDKLSKLDEEINDFLLKKYGRDFLIFTVDPLSVTSRKGENLDVNYVKLGFMVRNEEELNYAIENLVISQLNKFLDETEITELYKFKNTEGSFTYDYELNRYDVIIRIKIAHD